ELIVLMDLLDLHVGCYQRIHRGIQPLQRTLRLRRHVSRANRYRSRHQRPRQLLHDAPPIRCVAHTTFYLHLVGRSPRRSCEAAGGGRVGGVAFAGGTLLTPASAPARRALPDTPATSSRAHARAPTDTTTYRAPCRGRRRTQCAPHSARPAPAP